MWWTSHNIEIFELLAVAQSQTKPLDNSNSSTIGSAENGGPEKTGPEFAGPKFLKMQERKMQDHFAGLENAGLDFEGPPSISNGIICSEVV